MSSRSQPRSKKKKTSSSRRAASQRRGESQRQGQRQQREGMGRRVTEGAEHMVSSIKSALSGRKRQKAA